MMNSDTPFFYMNEIVFWLEASGFSYKYNNNGDLQTLVIQFDMERK